MIHMLMDVGVDELALAGLKKRLRNGLARRIAQLHDN